MDRWRSGVRPARSPHDRRADRDDEAVAQAWLLLLVPFPCVEDIEFGERVERDGEAQSVALRATFVDALEDVLPRHDLGFA